MSRVFAAMSGGVDSSVAAALLVQAGHDVTGVTMQLLPEGEGPGRCCGTAAVRDARRVCDVLGIPCYVLNVRREFAAEVIEPFCVAYARGETPNPCILCNDRIKFAELWRRAAQQGAESLATGHYARILHGEGVPPSLARGSHAAKDQSYFLYRMTGEQLERTMFPVGGLAKPEVRRIAGRLGLPTAHASESQDVCFVPDTAAAFVAERRPEAGVPGPIVDADGRVLGRHRGLANYTVGQRQGLGLSGGPYYVTDLLPSRNAVLVGPAEALDVRVVTCRDVVWHAAPECRVAVQTRYRQLPCAALARVGEGKLTLFFDEPVRGVARGQAAVCYDTDVVVGGGVVEEAR